MNHPQIPGRSLSELIRKARTSNDLTQASFGRLLTPHVAQPTVARWEKGDQIPDRKYFPKIASLLNLSLDELFEIIESQSDQDDHAQINLDGSSWIPNQKHLTILNRGALVWNRWREKNPEITPDLAGAKPIEQDLAGIDLAGADLRGIELHLTNLCGSNLIGANLQHASLIEVDLSGADLRDANLSQSDIQKSRFIDAKLEGANFDEATLDRANLYRANLTKANLRNASLKLTDLRSTILIDANFETAILHHCLVYGVSAWGVNLEGAVQRKLNITQDDARPIYVTDLRSAYIESLIIENPKIKESARQLQHDIEKTRSY